MDEFSVEQIGWPEAEPLVRPIREQVFVDEQQVPLALEWDGLDAECAHIVARDAAGTPIGTARMQPNGHIGRMAVLKPWRGRGVGTAMLRALLAYAQTQALGEVVLNAQTYVVGFYERLGFQAIGPEFMDAGIPHQRMIRKMGSVTEKWGR